MSRIFAIGDVHGYSDSLRRLIDKINPEARDKIVFLGDLVGRGPDSKGVLDIIIELKKSGIQVEVLLGNHDFAFAGILDVVDRDGTFAFGYSSDWWSYFEHESNGGAETLRSYSLPSFSELRAGLEKGKKFHHLIPEEHLQLILSMKMFHVENDWLFVHGGIPEAALKCKSVTDAIRLLGNHGLLGSVIQERYTEDIPVTFPQVIVHGHTPLSSLIKRAPLAPVEIKQLWQLNQICFWQQKLCIDTGVYKSGGKLTAVELLEGQDYKVFDVPGKPAESTDIECETMT